MSSSWVDPHFAALYARREEERLAERLLSRLRGRAACEPNLDKVDWRSPASFEQDFSIRAHFRLS